MNRIKSFFNLISHIVHEEVKQRAEAGVKKRLRKAFRHIPADKLSPEVLCALQQEGIIIF